MRFVAMLASMAVAVAAASLPASFVTIRADVDPVMTAADETDRDHDGIPDAYEARESDDDLDERLDDDLDGLDDLVAVLHHTTHAYVRTARVSRWVVHAPRSPRAPHPEDTLRPPIAS